jgi:DNA-binding beta-propeller fold protein YncE
MKGHLSFGCVLPALVLLALLGASASIAGSTTAVPNSTAQDARSRLVDIAVDNAGAIYVLDNGRDEVLKLDRGGGLLWRVSLQMRDGTNSNSYKLALNQAKDMAYVISNQADLRGVTADGKLLVLSSALGAYTDRIMGIDATGKLYYPNREKNRVEVYLIPPFSPEDFRPDLGGIFTNTTRFTPFIDGNVSGPAHLGRPHRVEVSPTGSRVWVLCQDYAFRIFDQEGEFVALVRAPDKQNRSFTSVDTEFTENDTIYIRSFEGRCILVYDANGRLLRLVPLTGYPNAFGLDRDGNFYLGRQTHWHGMKAQPDWAIDVLDHNGTLLRTINGPAAQASSEEAE